MSKLNDYKKTDFGYELNDEEAELLKAIDQGQFDSIDNIDTRKKRATKNSHKFYKDKT